MACIVCSADKLMPKSRKFCSRRCQMLESRARRGQNCRTHLVCQGCAEPFSIAARPGERKKRSDTLYCDLCDRLKTLRVVGSGVITVAQARLLGTTCGVCAGAVDLSLRKPDRMAPSIDHIDPLGLGGVDALVNLQMTHWGCNQRKHLRGGDADFGRSERQRLYRSREWKRFAAQVRAAEPRCRQCAAPTYCADHIVGIAEGGAVWDSANLQALCRRCHNAKSQREYRKRWASSQ